MVHFKPVVLLGALLSLCASEVFAHNLTTHDYDFVPHHILRVTAQNISINCESRYSVLVNGTHPGPTLRIPEEKTTWIRVYNDMTDQNLTMVRLSSYDQA